MAKKTADPIADEPVFDAPEAASFDEPEAPQAPPAPKAVAKKSASPDFDENKRLTRAKLDAEPRVRIRIPSTGKGAQLDETVCINGVVYLMQRGVHIEVPESVARVLENAELI
jgi:hypothetical protein